jgi:hypothetical protein
MSFDEFIEKSGNQNKDAIPGADSERAPEATPAFDIGVFDSYETVREHLTMQMVPTEGNEDMLSGVPHKTVEDMSVVYRIEVDEGEDSVASALVTNGMLDMFGVTPERLHEDAVASQSNSRPATLRNLSEVMRDISGGTVDVPDSALWVASVEDGRFGAACVQFPEFLDQAADKLGGDFFALPSSVHEMIFVPDDGSFSRAELERIVRNVNETEVAPPDYLSNNVYHYDSIFRIFEKAETFERRVEEEMKMFDPEPERETMTVLLVEPEKHPRKVEMGTELKDLQAAVGGYIEAVYPFEDQVCLIVNEEGKLDNLPLNRALRDDNGEIYDIVAGSFLVAGLTEESFGPLTPEQLQKYEQYFHDPEVFVRMGRGIVALSIPDEAVRKGTGHLMATEDKPRSKPLEESL